MAKFCQVYFLRELTQIPEFCDRQFSTALKKCFHRMDEMIESTVHDLSLSLALMFFFLILTVSVYLCLCRNMNINSNNSGKYRIHPIVSQRLQQTETVTVTREMRMRVLSPQIQMERKFLYQKLCHYFKNYSHNNRR